MKPLFSVVRDRLDLAEILQITPKKLSYLIKAPTRCKYSQFIVPKHNGGIRIIEAPKTSLKIIQKKLYEMLEPYYSAPSCVHGFVSGRSIITGASSHLLYTRERPTVKRNARYYLSLDIEDFFPSITSQRVYGLLIGKHLHASNDVAFAISRLCVGAQGLAQGSPVSPLISNMICLNMDRAILAFAKTNGLFYTRYADDITLSTSNRKRFFEVFDIKNGIAIPEELKKAITEHKGQKSFRINEKKTHYATPAHRQLITGIVVNEKMNVPREYYKKLRSCLHTWKRDGIEVAASKYYSVDFVDEEKIASFESSVYGKLDHYRNVVSGNGCRCTSLEKLGSAFNSCCTGKRFPVHKPEDALFNVTVYPIGNKGIPEEGVAFYLDGVGLVTARHVFDKFAMDGITLRVVFTSVVTYEKLEMNIAVSMREDEKQYDCVKIEIEEETFANAFPSIAPLPLADFSCGNLPITVDEDVTAFDVELISDADQGIRGYECTEIAVRCKKPSNANQYGRMSRVEGAEFYLGMSGGPVLNKYGEVVGIVRSGIKRGSGSRNAHSKFLFLDRLNEIPYGISPKE